MYVFQGQAKKCVYQQLGEKILHIMTRSHLQTFWNIATTSFIKWNVSISPFQILWSGGSLKDKVNAFHIIFDMFNSFSTFIHHWGGQHMEHMRIHGYISHAFRLWGPLLLDHDHLQLRHFVPHSFRFHQYHLFRHLHRGTCQFGKNS